MAYGFQYITRGVLTRGVVYRRLWWCRALDDPRDTFFAFDGCWSHKYSRALGLYCITNSRMDYALLLNTAEIHIPRDIPDQLLGYYT